MQEHGDPQLSVQPKCDHTRLHSRPRDPRTIAFHHLWVRQVEGVCSYWRGGVHWWTTAHMHMREWGHRLCATKYHTSGSLSPSNAVKGSCFTPGMQSTSLRLVSCSLYSAYPELPSFILQMSSCVCVMVRGNMLCSTIITNYFVYNNYVYNNNFFADSG